MFEFRVFHVEWELQKIQHTTFPFAMTSSRCPAATMQSPEFQHALNRPTARVIVDASL